jgi:hypothetical protein
MTDKGKISEVLVVAAIAAFGYWRYSKMTAAEKDKIQSDIKEIREKVIRALLPQGIKSLLPSVFK